MLIHPLESRDALHAPFPASLSARYDIVLRQVPVAGMVYSLLAVRDTNALLDAIDPLAFSPDERMPYWAELWPASVSLAEVCTERRARFGGSGVLELGCGLGLAGIAAAMAGASVTFTDYEQDALLFAQYNASLNLPGGMPSGSFRIFDWRVPADLGHFRCILGADLLYEERNFVPLMNVLDSHLDKGGVALFTDPGRTVAEEFGPYALKRGYQVLQSGRYESNSQKNIVLIEVRR